MLYHFRRISSLLLQPLVVAIVIFTPFAAHAAKEKPAAPEKGYTINFDNVPIQEFLKFISKIAKINVIYNEEDLDFNVTIVSEEETDLQNVMSALVQVLRINGLTLIEEDQNLLIHKNDNVKQIPTVVSSELPMSPDMRPAIITKVFKIAKGNPSHIAALITPMLSREAMVEVSMETRQLIITDVASSLNTVQDLLLSLDAPETPYDLETYVPKYLSVEELAPIAKKILAPISDNATLELVVQPDTQTIYIISTPFLIHRTLNIFNEIDKKSLVSSNKALNGENVLIYKLRYKTKDAIVEGLKKIASEATSQGFKSPSLSETINNVKYVEATHSLLFIGPPNDLKIVSTFLNSIDTSVGVESSSSSYYLYEPTNMSSEEATDILKEISDHLKKTGYTHPSVILSVENAEIIEPIDAILFSGTPETITEVKALLASIEASYEDDLKKTGGSKFLIYNIKQAHEEQIRKSLNHLADYLEVNKFPNEPLIHTIDSMRWVKSSNSLMFTGNSKALTELNELLPTFDVPPSASKSALYQIPPSTEFIIYSPKHVTANFLMESIKSTTQNLKAADLADPGLIRSLESMRTLPPSDQLIFTGDASSLSKLSVVLTDLDNENSLEYLHEGPYFVTIKYASYSRVKNALDNMIKDMNKNDPIPLMVKSMQFLSDSNTLILHGSQEALTKVKEVINITDSEVSGSHVEFVRLQHRSVDEVINFLHDTAAKLKRAATTRNDAVSNELISTLDDVQGISHSNTLILSGNEASLQKVKELISNDDQPYLETKSEIYLYKLKYLSPDELKNSLNGIAEHAHNKGDGTSTHSLEMTINTMRVVPNSDAIQFVGPPTVITKLKDLLLVLDTSDNATSKVKKHLGANFLVYNVKHSNPTELLDHVKQLANSSANAKQDTDLTKALASGRYARESNSLIFSGDKTSLDKINNLLDKLDAQDETTASPWREAEGYKIYKPEFVPGPQLVQMVKNFESHLVSSGVTNQSLAEVIDHLSYIPRTNTIIVTGTAKEMDEVISLLKEFDTQETASGQTISGINDVETIDDTGFLLYKLQHQNGEGLVVALQQISIDLSTQDNQKKNQPLIDSIKSVQYIQMTNTLMATGQPKVLTKLRDLLESMDVALKQVFIEILVLETTMDKDLEFGLRWGSQGKENNKFSWGTGNYSATDTADGFTKNMSQITGSRVPTGSDIPPIQGGFLGVIGDIVWHKGKSYASLGSMINALKTDGDTTIVLSQKIVCQDSQNAKIFSGDNIPFTGSLVTTSGLTQTTNANLEYRNIGVTVSITPIIGENGVITLDIDHEISEEVNPGDDSGGSVNVKSVNGIRTSRTTMTTKVHMPNQHFLVLSGTMRNQVVRSVSGIPCLGGLPLVGAAFSSTKKSTENRNVIIFVKPHIIDSNETYYNITEQQEEIYGSKQQANVQDFQTGLELIRAPDDEDYEDE